MLETPKFPEINHPGYFVGGEHPIHQCFEEFSSDVSSDLPPDVSATFSEVVQIGRARDTNAVSLADYFVDQSLAFPI
jgi:hypothetical protein